MTIPTIGVLSALRQQTLGELWSEAESLGFLRIWTQTNWGDTERTGYKVTLIARRKSTKFEIERQHTSLICALADAINEAREMGLGDNE